MKRVYYKPGTGEITGHDSGNDQPFEHPDHVWVEMETDIHPHPKMHIIDVATKTIRDMTDAEKVTANLPTEFQVRHARYLELKEFDWRENHPGWKEHRQALRDITKAGDAIAMVKAWPLRPDGTDAISHLRARAGA